MSAPSASSAKRPDPFWDSFRPLTLDKHPVDQIVGDHTLSDAIAPGVQPQAGDRRKPESVSQTQLAQICELLLLGSEVT